MLLGIPAKNLARPPTPPPVDSLKGVVQSFQNLETGSRTEVFGKETRRDDVWVECEEVVSFKASDNRIQRLDFEIGAFGGLKAIDVRYIHEHIVDYSFETMI